jgi:hypothetical protein
MNMRMFQEGLDPRVYHLVCEQSRLTAAEIYYLIMEEELSKVNL